jgi:hypothetical protein
MADANERRPLLCRALNAPAACAKLSISEWELLVRQARASGLLARLAGRLDAAGASDAIPQPARWHFDAARALGERQRIAVRWEVEQIRLALAGLTGPVVALTGAAYVIADLPAAAGRLFNDVDILVPRAQLDEAESALQLAGWHASGLSDYDERYYRRWMHEIPPLRHLRRGSALDLHHAILPDTARRPPFTAKLLERVEAVADFPGVYVLGHEDRVLHSAVHLFHDGELPHGLRDLSDLDLLFSDPANPADFWSRLVARAVELGLGRELFYAARYASHYFATPVPDDAIAALRVHAPRGRLALMDAIFLRALGPRHPSCDDRHSTRARLAAYVRAHWLRMPPHLLLPHLFHKAVIAPWQERREREAA